MKNRIMRIVFFYSLKCPRCQELIGEIKKNEKVLSRFQFQALNVDIAEVRHGKVPPTVDRVPALIILPSAPREEAKTLLGRAAKDWFLKLFHSNEGGGGQKAPNNGMSGSAAMIPAAPGVPSSDAGKGIPGMATEPFNIMTSRSSWTGVYSPFGEQGASENPTDRFVSYQPGTMTSGGAAGSGGGGVPSQPPMGAGMPPRGGGGMPQGPGANGMMRPGQINHATPQMNPLFGGGATPPFQDRPQVVDSSSKLKQDEMNKMLQQMNNERSQIASGGIVGQGAPGLSF